MLREWRAAGLLTAGRSLGHASAATGPRQPVGAPPDAAESAATISMSVDADAAAPAARAIPVRTDSALTENALVRTRYTVLDFAFELHADPAVAPLMATHLGHFALAGAEAASELDSGEPWPAFHVLARDGRWGVWFDGELVGECEEAADVVPIVHGNLIVLTYRESDCLAALHAAAVSKGDACVVLPGASGSGKSTLAAALVARGYGYCTDDLAVLSHAPIGLRPVPVPIGLKQGAWCVLEPFFPGVMQLRQFRRADGKLVRYLLPDAAPRIGQGSEPRRVAALVFPIYRANAEARLVPIARSDAFLRLTSAGYDLKGTLSAAWVERLVGWIREVDCYALEYADLDAAIERFAVVL